MMRELEGCRAHWQTESHSSSFPQMLLEKLRKLQDELTDLKNQDLDNSVIRFRESVIQLQTYVLQLSF